MMRELKFRAWNEELKRIIPFEDLSEFPLLALKSDGVWTFEQYTGLKDENGKEIYEGDIVRVSYGYNYEVRQFKTGAWRIGRDDLCVWADSSGVIGNIHENPELLEGE